MRGGANGGMVNNRGKNRRNWKLCHFVQHESHTDYNPRMNKHVRDHFLLIVRLTYLKNVEGISKLQITFVSEVQESICD